MSIIEAGNLVLPNWSLSFSLLVKRLSITVITVRLSFALSPCQLTLNKSCCHVWQRIFSPAKFRGKLSFMDYHSRHALIAINCLSLDTAFPYQRNLLWLWWILYFQTESFVTSIIFHDCDALLIFRHYLSLPV